MSAVAFEERRDGRTDVMLGVVPVGTIMPLDHPEVRTVWWITLPSAPVHPRGAADTDSAKAAATRAVNNWLHAAGLLERKGET